MPIYKFLVQNKTNDPRNGGDLNDAHALGFQHLKSIQVQHLYFIEGQLSQEELQQLALKLLSDPVTQIASWMELPSALSQPEDDSVMLEVALRPGVTDPVAEQLVRAAHELNLNGVHRAATGQRFVCVLMETLIAFPHHNPLQKACLPITSSSIGHLATSRPLSLKKLHPVELSRSYPIRNLSNDELLSSLQRPPCCIGPGGDASHSNLFRKRTA